MILSPGILDQGTKLQWIASNGIPDRIDEEMAIMVSLAPPLQKFAGGRGKVEVDGKNIAEAIEALESLFPGIKASLLDGRGRVLSHINIFLNDRDIQALQEIETPIHGGDQVVIIPAIAGGSEGEQSGR